MDESETHAIEILMDTRCAICPNKIGIAEYGLINDQEAIAELQSRDFAAPVLDGPEGKFMLVHTRCIENAKLVI